MRNRAAPATSTRSMRFLSNRDSTSSSASSAGRWHTPATSSMVQLPTNTESRSNSVPLGRSEQVVAPRDGGAERAMPGRPVRRLALQQPHPPAQAGDQLARAQRLEPRGRQLQRERHAVQPDAGVDNRGHVLGGQGELGAYPAGPFHQQGDARVRGDHRDVADVRR